MNNQDQYIIDRDIDKKAKLCLCPVDYIGFVLNNRDADWDWRSISYNPIITPEIVKTYSDKIPFCWRSIAQNSSITLEYIKQDSRLYKEYSYMLSLNPNLTWEFIKEYNLRIDYMISAHNNITWDIIKANPDETWVSLESNPNIADILMSEISKLKTIESEWLIIPGYPKFKFNLRNFISTNPNCPWELISKTYGDTKCNNFGNIVYKTIPYTDAEYEYNYEWRSISEYNNNITLNIIINNLHYPWSWEMLSIHNNITWEDIKSHLELPWDWEVVSTREDITWEIVQDNPNLPWDHDSLISNPNFTFDIIRQNPEYFTWNYKQLSQNSMHQPYYLKEAKRNIKRCLQIKHELIQFIINPDNLLKYGRKWNIHHCNLDDSDIIVQRLTYLFDE